MTGTGQTAEPERESAQGPELHYQQALDAGRFLIQRCVQCTRHVFQPRSVCPHCGDDRLGWVEAAGGGTVYSTTTVRRKPDAGGDYDVSLIDLDEGVRMKSRVEGIAPANVKIGMRVRAAIVRQKNGALVIFRPEAAGGESS